MTRETRYHVVSGRCRGSGCITRRVVGLFPSSPPPSSLWPVLCSASGWLTFAALSSAQEDPEASGLRRIQEHDQCRDTISACAWLYYSVLISTFFFYIHSALVGRLRGSSLAVQHMTGHTPRCPRMNFLSMQGDLSSSYS